jgi:hypothetical protein
MVSVGWLVLVERPIVGRLLVVLGTLGWAEAVMTMSGDPLIGSVLGGGLAAAMVAWIVWVLFERRRLARLQR